VCKSEYDAWRQSQPQPPDVFLYFDGTAMKGTLASNPIGNDAALSDDTTKKVKADCVAANPASVAAERVALESEAAAKSAAEAADTSKNSADKQEADRKAETARAARQVADLAAQTASITIALRFDLSPDLVATADPKDTSWRQLLARPRRCGPLAVSAGPAAGPWPSYTTIPFERVDYWWLAGWAALFLAAIVLFVRYAKNSDIIRDTGSLPSGVSGRKSFSLARTQMAMWTFLVAGALAFIFLVTWNENTLSSGVLVLIGISSGTTLLAATADGTNPVPQVTQGFFTDLLTDGAGPSFHRYQMLLFTLVLAVIFVVMVANDLTMPEFDATLLGLMGISNGTYLGFKLQGR
jgi:hypothetical protein